MNEYPILFKGEMVKAILKDLKTQTRRVISPQPFTQPYIMIPGPWWAEPDPYNDGPIRPKKCPYGKAGDRLWVRETFQYCRECGGRNFFATVNNGPNCQHCDAFLGKWKPSIFMFREESRLTLDVLNVRVERLQDITPDDAIKEGVNLETWEFHQTYDDTIRLDLAAHEEFKHLWDKINVKRGFGWESNPWVWAVTFQRVRA